MFIWFVNLVFYGIKCFCLFIGIVLHCPKPKWNTYVEYLSFGLVGFRLFHFVCWSYNLCLVFFFSGLSLVAFTVGLFISFCYCTIILIKWIFKQINADSIRISLFFCCCCTRRCFCCCCCCCCICGAFGSGNCCYATRSNAQHAERELHGAAGKRERGIRWFQISATETETHVWNNSNNNNADAAMPMWLRHACPTSGSRLLQPCPNRALSPPLPVVFLTQIALKIPCTLLSLAIFNGNCTTLFPIFFSSLFFCPKQREKEKPKKWKEFAWCAINLQFVPEKLMCLTVSAWFTNRDSRQSL